MRADPRSFLEKVRLPVILDEIQHVPEILNYVRARIDRAPRKTGQWLLTGSQESPLMKGVTESMAGRAAVLQLLPFSSAELLEVLGEIADFDMERPAHSRLRSSTRKSCIGLV